ncbi:Major facilitator superfamily domain-containing protein 6-like protein [Leptotrombidium deliense]|uniref:Major facilitator superfamily domain-containing protein 6-like protein n=1 Tax=Leptotrombidium deliense TaxID=299467 RepID=A0A443ST58_9ACAR|nr:Major facilitator superfamily domain-containing protein 6-like protein [Leptotrombidium deliense]
MRQLGLSVEETAVIISILPIASLLGPPTTGFIADKYRMHKLLLLISLLMTIISAFGIQMLPKSRTLDGDFNRIKFRCNQESVSLKVPKKCTELCQRDDITLNIKNCVCSNNSLCIIGQLENLTVCFGNETLNAKLFPTENCIIPALRIFTADPITPPLHWIQCPHTCHCDVDLLQDAKRQCKLEVNKRQDTKTKHIFWLYLGLRLMFSCFSSICFNLIDAAALLLTENENCKTFYGKQRMWAALATGVFPPLCGYMIDQMSEDPEYQETTNYAPAFYAFYGLVAITILCSLFLTIDKSNSNRNIWKELRNFLKTYEHWLFVISVLALGVYFGFIENFLFWFLQDISAPKYLMGLTLTVGALAGLPVLYKSEFFLEKMGRVNILILSFFVYFVRLYGYSVIENPWHCMWFESMEAVTYHLMWVAASTYGAKLTPEYMATMLSVIAIIHYECGPGLGSLIGGSVMSITGARKSFRLMGYSAIAFGVSYILLFYGIRINKWKRISASSDDKITQMRETKINRSETNKDNICIEESI